MIQIRDDTYNIDLRDLLKRLRNDIYKKNECSLFGYISEQNKASIKVTCPIHKRGQETKPSCFVSTNGLVHCFSCNYSSDIYSMISELLYNRFDGGLAGKKYIEKLYKLDKENIRDFNLNALFEKIEKNRDGVKEVKKIISEDELEKYRYFHPYMYKRQLTNEIIEKFDIGFDGNYKYFDKIVPCITMPVKDIEGDVITIIRRAVKFKRFFIENHIKKPVYGVYEITKEKDVPIFITESVFNCLTLWIWGFESVALIGLGNDYQFNILKKLPNRLFYTCMDGDNAGREAAKKINQKLFNKFVFNIDMLDSKDVNDLSKEQFLELLNECKNKTR